MSAFDIDKALVDQAARMFLKATEELAANYPHPAGRTLRLTVAAVDDGQDLGHVDIDVTNLWALASYAARRGGTAETIRHTFPEPTGKPTLRLITDKKRTS